MRFLLAAVLAAGLLGPSLADASPFGPNRSEGAPPTKRKAKKVKKAKKPVQVEDDEIVDAKPAKVAKPEKAKPEKKAKPEPVDEELVIIEETAPKKVAAKAEKPTKPEAKKPTKPAVDEEVAVVEDKPAKKAKPETKKPIKPAVEEVVAVVEDKPAKKAKPEAKPTKPAADEELVIIEETPAKPAVAKVGATAKVGAKKPAAEEPADDEEIATDDEKEAPTRVARIDGDPGDEAEPAVTKTAIKAKPHRTRFYFRAGGMKQSTKLGAAQFSLQTDLPIDTSNLGAGSGVETQQNQIPVGAIIGVVLPVLDRKLSIETVLGIPTPTKFQATGQLATESLAPTFMGMATGIEALGPDLGEVTFAPPIVTGVYRIAKLGPVTPIAGAGLMLLMGRNGKITNTVLQEAGDPKLSIKPSPGLVVQGGLDIALWKRVAARIDVKYVFGMKVNATIEDIAVTPKAIPALGSIEVGDAVLSAKVAPLIIQAGVGVDF